MSKKRLEAAIQAGREQKGNAAGDVHAKKNELDRMEELSTHKYDELRDGIYSLQFTHDTSKIAVGYGDGCIELFSVSPKQVKLEKELKKGKHGGLAVTCIKFKSNEQHVCLAGTSEGNVHLCSVIDATCQTVVKEPENEINCLDLNNTGSRFATAGKDLTVRIYDTETCKLTSSYKGYSYNSPEQSHAGHAQRIFALRYFPEEEPVFVTGGWDNHLKIWDSRTADGVIGTIPGPHICGDSIDIKRTTLLTGSWVASDALQLWDLGSCSLLRNVPVKEEVGGQGQFVYCCRLCDDGVVLSAGSGTQSVQAYSVNKEKFIGEIKLHRPVQAMDVIDGGRLFAFGGVGCQLKFGALR